MRRRDYEVRLSAWIYRRGKQAIGLECTLPMKDGKAADALAAPFMRRIVKAHNGACKKRNAVGKSDAP